MKSLLVAGALLELVASARSFAQESRAGWRALVRVVDERGKPVEGADVRARLPFAVAYSDLSRKDFRARSDASGTATFGDLPPEQPVVFEVAQEPWVPTRSLVVMPHPDGDGAGAAIPEIVLTEGRTAQVSARDAFGVPVEDAEVRILPLVESRLERGGRATGDAARGSTRTARVDGAGSGRFERLPAELLTVEVRAVGFEARMATVDLRRSASADLAVRLDRDPEPPPATMPWLDSVRDAFAVADAGGLPVMVAMTMDGERANDSIAEHHFRDPEVIRVARLLPCLVASVFEHGETDGACTRYGSVSCSAHQAVESWARDEFLADVPSFQVPRHIFASPDGRVLAHREYYLSERDLRWMMLRALRDAGSDSAVWMCIRRLQPLWRALCAEGDSENRRAATATLARLVESGDGYAAMLLRGFALAAMPGDVRLQVLDAILVPALDDPARALEGFLHDAEPAVRIRAWQRLAAVADRIDCEIAAGALAFEDNDAALDAALRALRVDERADSLVVAESDSGDRWRIVEVLLERIDAAALKGIDAVLDQTLTEGRNRVLRALAANPEDESGVRRLFSHASAPEPGAVAAIRALAEAPRISAERVRDLLMEQARCANPLVRQEAVTQLGRRQPPGATAVLEGALADPILAVRAVAAIALWRHGSRSGAAVLVDALDDPELGGEARAVLESAYLDGAPGDAEAWRRCLEEGWGK